MNGTPLFPVRLVFRYAVQEMVSTGTPSAPVRYKVDTAFRASFVYLAFRGTVMVVLVRPWPAPPWLASTTTVAVCAAAVAAPRNSAALRAEIMFAAGGVEMRVEEEGSESWGLRSR